MYAGGAKLLGNAKDKVTNMGKAGQEAASKLIGGISGLFGKKDEL